MPLAFESTSHGRIAFGFFNIESDMLLLEHYFLFATDFCRFISQAVASDPVGDTTAEWGVFHIADRNAIGDLMGAIHGIRHTGFIGEVYRRFPFPAEPENFKQNPDGDCTQPQMNEIISHYAQKKTIQFNGEFHTGRVSIGEYRFDRTVFQALVRYVWQGGYPRWRNQAPPAYVREMKQQVERGRHPIFHHISFFGVPPGYPIKDAPP